MNKSNPNSFPESTPEQLERKENAPARDATRKEFVEPVISVPIDVLETTSFFQSVTTVDTSDV